MFGKRRLSSPPAPPAPPCVFNSGVMRSQRSGVSAKAHITGHALGPDAVLDRQMPSHDSGLNSVSHRRPRTAKMPGTVAIWGRLSDPALMKLIIETPQA